MRQLVVNNRYLIAAPLVTTGPAGFYDLPNVLLIPLQLQQLNAVYAVLSTIADGFADSMDIAIQLRKTLTDVILGISASISSVESVASSAYSLKTADAISCAVVGLSARNKVLEWRAGGQKPVSFESKTVSRCVPRTLVDNY